MFKVGDRAILARIEDVPGWDKISLSAQNEYKKVAGMVVTIEEIWNGRYKVLTDRKSNLNLYVSECILTPLREDEESFKDEKFIQMII